MQRYKKILVGVDDSNAGYNALAEAIRLAHWGRGRVSTLTVCPSYDGDLSLVGVRDIKALITGSCEAMADRVLEIGENMHAEIEIAYSVGKPFEEIRRRTAEGRYDLVVLGGRRYRGIRAWFGNSTSYAVVRGAATDILIVPEQSAIAWEEMLLVDYGDSINSGHLQRASDLATAYGGHLTALLVRHGSHMNTALCSDTLKIHPTIIRDSRATPDQVIAHAGGKGVGLIILGARANDRIDIRHSIYLKRIWNQSPCPTLMLKCC